MDLHKLPLFKPLQILSVNCWLLFVIILSILFQYLSWRRSNSAHNFCLKYLVSILTSLGSFISVKNFDFSWIFRILLSFVVFLSSSLSLLVFQLFIISLFEYADIMFILVYLRAFKIPVSVSYTIFGNAVTYLLHSLIPDGSIFTSASFSIFIASFFVSF